VRKTLGDDAALEKHKLGRQAARPDAEILRDSRAEKETSGKTAGRSPFYRPVDQPLMVLLDADWTSPAGEGNGEEDQ